MNPDLRLQKYRSGFTKARQESYNANTILFQKSYATFVHTFI